jgi:hypothetical protein
MCIIICISFIALARKRHYCTALRVNQARGGNVDVRSGLAKLAAGWMPIIGVKTRCKVFAYRNHFIAPSHAPSVIATFREPILDKQLSLRSICGLFQLNVE